MYCQYCGKYIEAQAKFCANCGKEVSAIQEKVQEAPVAVTAPQPTTNTLKGLGGWLTVVGLSLAAFALSVIKTVAGIGSVYMDGTMTSVNDPSSALYVAHMNTSLRVEEGLAILLGCIVAGTFYLYYRRSRQFPISYIGLHVANVVFGIIDAFLLSSLTSSTPAIQQILESKSQDQWLRVAAAAIGAIIWIAYIKKSKRVKATFVE